MSDVSNFAAVGAFHVKFGIDNTANGVQPKHIPHDLQAFRLKTLHEELTELERAYENHDLAGIADALVDLVYFALGTAQVHGLPWQELFDEVQRANMSKERCGIDHVFEPCHTPGSWAKPSDACMDDHPGDPDHTIVCAHCNEDGYYCHQPRVAHSLRGSAHDVIKPEGWTPPDIDDVLQRFGWKE